MADESEVGQVLTTYPITIKVDEQIERAFKYHTPKTDQGERYVLIRAEGKALARTIATLTPMSREQSLALTKLEEAIFWANAAIARGE
jgi:hypothetical protein